MKPLAYHVLRRLAVVKIREAGLTTSVTFASSETVPFGEWQKPIGYQETAEGGGCAPGCHLPMKYNRNAVSGTEPVGRQ